jgi:Transposase domain (DUF772)
MEQLDYNLLYRWFVGLGVDEPVWVPTVFTKNRDRLLEADVARKFLAELMDHKELRGLLSDEHFSVDGTQIAAWASMKSFKANDGSSDPTRGRAAMTSAIFTARSAATPPMPRPRIGGSPHCAATAELRKETAPMAVGRRKLAGPAPENWGINQLRLD